MGPIDCTPFRWRADNALDLNCYDPQDEQWRVITVGPGAQEAKENKSATATPPETGPWVQPDFFVSDGVWAGPFTADADARLAPDTTRSRHRSQRRLPATHGARRHGWVRAHRRLG